MFFLILEKNKVYLACKTNQLNGVVVGRKFFLLNIKLVELFLINRVNNNNNNNSNQNPLILHFYTNDFNLFNQSLAIINVLSRPLANKTAGIHLSSQNNRGIY